MHANQKVIGIIGGASWESTALYYQLINQLIREKLGNLNSAKMVLYSINYDPVVRLEQEGKWEEIGKKLASIAKTIQDAGADFVILCCNTLHKVAPRIEDALDIPFVHIADAAGGVLTKRGICKIGLLGTRFTMEDGFYSDRLQQKFGLKVVLPKAENRIRMDQIIYNELCQGKILSTSKSEVVQMIKEMQHFGAEAILLGCTELGMLISAKDAIIPIFDTTQLHVQISVQMSLSP